MRPICLLSLGAVASKDTPRRFAGSPRGQTLAADGAGAAGRAAAPALRAWPAEKRSQGANFRGAARRAQTPPGKARRPVPRRRARAGPPRTRAGGRSAGRARSAQRAARSGGAQGRAGGAQPGRRRRRLRRNLRAPRETGAVKKSPKQTQRRHGGTFEAGAFRSVGGARAAAKPALATWKGWGAAGASWYFKI